MFKALWFAVKVGLLIAVAIWVAERPGNVRLEWMDYVVTVQMGAFLLVVLALMLLSIFVYTFIKAIVTFPASLARYNEVKAREKGFHALTLGLTAVAAGDTKAAIKHSQKAKKYLSADEGLPLLLEAQAARLDGREEDAARSFVALLENKEASFLGVRGLLQAALDAQDYEVAQRLCQRALKNYPKQPWILNIAYDLALKQKSWDEALGVLKRAEKAGAVKALKAHDDRAVIMLAKAEDYSERGFEEAALDQIKKARRAASDFAPVHLKLAEFYADRQDLKAARKVIEKVWRMRPHDAYVHLWSALIESKVQGDKLEVLKHMARLVKLNGANALAQRAAGEAALDAGLWGEARAYFEASEKLGATSQLYRLRGQLEERYQKNDVAARAWMEKAMDAPADKVWVCRDTGRIFERWHAIIFPHGGFNTLEWILPGGPKSGGYERLGRTVIGGALPESSII